MKIIVIGVLLLILGSQFITFFRIVRKMKQPVFFPDTEEDLKAIWNHSKKALELPIHSLTKRFFMWMGVLLLFLLLIVVLDIYDSAVGWGPYAMFVTNLLLINQYLWRIFVIVDDGVLCRGRFLPWKRIRSYHFEELHTNHPAYHSPEISCAYELKIKTKYSSAKCFVTSEVVKEKITGLLDERLRVTISATSK
ncbi:hypothetical protein MHZ92_12125 [Sporosarcina sp. ACRSL]|uniref:hypothetical protein n=1 Tax=Sporosarcina sp. ACRSL TaxID=2918215 RepID=UPI001EF6EC4B|nr:hypothetical protein [Sporosarcina sp. ACRSL]MCG7344885.1 hypothetical protein [Sporosarcina sp. ACRSL]